MADGAPNQQQQQQQQQQFRMLIAQPRYQQLIRPDSIAKLPGISDEYKTRMTSGARQLWNAIQTKPQEDALHQEAIRKLQQLTNTLLNQAKRATSQQNIQPGSTQSDAGRPQSQGNPQPTQQNGGAQSSQSQQPQPQSQQQQPPGQGQQQPQPQQQPQQRPQAQRPQSQQNLSDLQQQNIGNGHVQVPEKFRQQAESIPWLIPQNQQKEPAYRAELTRRYAEALWKKESAQAILQNIENLRSQGKELPQSAAQESQKAGQTLTTCNTFLEQITTQQNTLRQQQQSQSQQAARNANGGAIANAQNAQSTPASAQSAQSMRPLPNAALEAARQQQMSRPPTGSPVTAQPASATSPNPNMSGTPTTQQQNFQNLQRPQQGFAQSPQVSAPNSAAPLAQNPQQSQQAQVSQAQPQTVPLTHQGAMDAAAKSYQNNATPQQPGSATQMQGQLMRPEVDKTNASRWTIDKNFKVEPPRPVQMGAQRPTMAGPNGGPIGMIGQPALQQPPTYSLHGPGDRVLDKKKLDELVRQVCGAGDGSGQQSLHPEVEESVLQLADEFFDNVVTQACRLAKLRGGNTLEIRDIQLVLQKQYNIRIPGYSTDEVRTVRKVQPAASYLQKMNAVQAAKVMGGKTDI